MTETATRDVEYWHEDSRMVGLVCAPQRSVVGATGVLLIHDAFGISDEMVAKARRLAEVGHPVFMADVWGDRRTPTSELEVGHLLASMAADRSRWMARIAAAHRTLATQPEFAERPVALLGYCFGGSSALEYLRTGAEVAGVAAIHPGLDLLEQDWSAASSGAVLTCIGADDPMANATMRATLATALDTTCLDWQAHVYSDTTHAFTSPKAANSAKPELFAYHPRSTARAWAATTSFLAELCASTAS